jgi:hypothetical protein
MIPKDQKNMSTLKWKMGQRKRHFTPAILMYKNLTKKSDPSESSKLGKLYGNCGLDLIEYPLYYFYLYFKITSYTLLIYHQCEIFWLFLIKMNQNQNDINCRVQPVKYLNHHVCDSKINTCSSYAKQRWKDDALILILFDIISITCNIVSRFEQGN